MPRAARTFRWGGAAQRVGLALIALASLSGGPTDVGLSGTGYVSRMISLRPPGPGRHLIEIDAAGHTWKYLVHAPPCDDGTTTRPLVLVLHGSGLSGRSYLDEAGWADLADSKGFLVAAPDGLPARPGYEAGFWLNPKRWNSGQEPPSSPRSQVDDLLFFRALLDDLEARWPVDRSRVFVVGHSNGGAMALRLGVELSDRFAAAASVAGLCYVESPRPRQPRPLLYIGGTADPILPLEGGPSILPWEVRTTPPVLAHLETLAAEALGADVDSASTEMSEGLVVRRYPPGCVGGAGMVVMLLEGHGHGWPGPGRFGPKGLMGPTTEGFDATREIWTFFERVASQPLGEGEKKPAP